MGVAPFQPSLLDGALLDGALLDDAPSAALGPLGGAVRRHPLSHGAWVDVRRGWVQGADVVFARLREEVPWRAEQRPMHDRVVAVPRLLAWYGQGAVLPDPLLGQARHALDEHYGGELGEPFATAGLCLYRDGRDSVAWHGDRIGRGARVDTMVAIVVLGSPRPLLLRPRNGGSALRFDLGHGDVVVMGGSCQRTWDHAVPKTARHVGPRISVQFRPRDVR
ncbi:DNA-N1-methyladenine dioxygenase [Frankia sp. AiPs1]|uniref:alpha-ketoglutarate-dependent dioxygenase AlkB n=1 Tax=Frankia sp. AiPa1 TaxID=573492 RepID=UPI00202AD0DF|nr:alpha-ketoglutarate-dependent dioxygenase AlkB [Frankia sp. AiPa1]MCL9762496.1 alpha-ketoglutarate-dependent dioxygenase AlkB [Frankia sp. AiPa1]